jgi:hypothetical protein
VNGRWRCSATAFVEQVDVGGALVVEKQVHNLVRALGEGYLRLKVACRHYETEKHSHES